MPFQLPELPYAMNALEPYISRETLEYHYGKHHQAYVTNLNNLIARTPFESLSLEEIILKSEGGIFNNAAQVWNHTFYWNCLKPQAPEEPKGKFAQLLYETFDSFEAFKEQFSKVAIGTFGSGWVWLVQNPDESLVILSTSNAATPMTIGQKALLTCDVWEHAYYIDHRNSRVKYVENFWKLVNWDFVIKNWQA